MLLKENCQINQLKKALVMLVDVLHKYVLMSQVQYRRVNTNLHMPVIKQQYVKDKKMISVVGLKPQNYDLVL